MSKRFSGISGTGSTPRKDFIEISTEEIPLKDIRATEHVGDTSPKSQLFRHLVDRWWLWELIACCISLASLLAVLAILLQVEDKPVPSWKIRSRYAKADVPITINAVISILATCFKSTLAIPLTAALGQQKWLWFQNSNSLIDFQIFDAAIRGPLGSLLLIWDLRARRLACLGALLTIAALASDFSFQQLVTIRADQQNSTKQASVPRLTVYNTTTDTDVALYAGGSAKIYGKIDPSLIAAMYLGMFSDESTQFLVKPICETGNCTWPSYTSLGVCSKCYDITNKIQRQCGKVVLNYETPSDRSYDTGPTNFVPTYSATNCSWSLPNGLSVSNTTGNSAGNDTATNSVSHDGFIRVKSTMHEEGEGRGNFANITSQITMMSLLNATFSNEQPIIDDIGTTQNSSLLEHAFAAECALYFCVRKFLGKVELGKFSEHTVDTFADSLDLGISATYGGKESAFQPPASFFDKADVMRGPYLVDSRTADNAQSQFDDQVKCESKGNSPSDFGGSCKFWDGSATFSSGSLSADNDFIRKLSQLDFIQLEKTMENLAQAFTTSLRSHPSLSKDDVVNGTALQTVNFVRARVSWIILPATLWVLTTTFLALTAVQTFVRDVSAWKTSSLPILFHPLNQDGLDHLGPASTPIQMEKQASNIHVKSQRTDDGYRLLHM